MCIRDRPCKCDKFEKGIDFAPTSCYDYCSMIDSFKSYSTGKTAEIITISLNRLNTYYNSFNFGQDGFRIYYGLINNKLLQIISISNEANQLDSGYCVLTKNNNYSINLNNFISRDSAIILIRNYVNAVTRLGNNSNPLNSSDTVTFARYYAYSGLDSLIANVKKYIDTPGFITFEQCYVPLDISILYKSHPNVWYKGIPDDFNVGYSTIMYLQKKGIFGKPVAILTREIQIAPGKYPDDYQSGFLEIGKPCPPRCGSISWDDIINVN